MSFDITIYFQFFISLFALVNPIGNLPIFNSYTYDLKENERNAVNVKAFTALGVILLVSLFCGQAILNFFSISMNSFRIAGGILITLIALSMIRGTLSNTRDPHNDIEGGINVDNIAIVPLAIPILAGPGAISSVILFGAKHPHIIELLLSSFTILIFCFFCSYLFRYSYVVLNKLGKSGQNVIMRIMGIIVMALGVEMITEGISHVVQSIVH